MISKVSVVLANGILISQLVYTYSIVSFSHLFMTRQLIPSHLPSVCSQLMLFLFSVMLQKFLAEFSSSPSVLVLQSIISVAIYFWNNKWSLVQWYIFWRLSLYGVRNWLCFHNYNLNTASICSCLISVDCSFWKATASFWWKAFKILDKKFFVFFFLLNILFLTKPSLGCAVSMHRKSIPLYRNT